MSFGTSCFTVEKKQIILCVLFYISLLFVVSLHYKTDPAVNLCSVNLLLGKNNAVF